ncbi:RusA family crossover junction endodeoxyribonuclease [Candidatus Williamhamiltonella defendens]|uniref:RusA family crossover junction endodeoxyribonuclease n=1 Tax=Candidatus Williamhamiltonella defendens TaxID=138072 RepID=UPI000B34A393
MAIRIELPFPPSVNHYWVRTARRVYLSEAAKRFQRLTAIQVAQSSMKQGHHPFLGDVSVLLTLYLPDKRVRDVDNYPKARQWMSVNLRLSCCFFNLIHPKF